MITNLANVTARSVEIVLRGSGNASSRLPYTQLSNLVNALMSNNNIKKVTLTCSYIDNQSLSIIYELTKLSTLNLNFSTLDTESIKMLATVISGGKLAQLTRLTVNNTMIKNDATLEYLPEIFANSQLNPLKSICITHAFQFNNTNPNALKWMFFLKLIISNAKLGNLQELNLRNNYLGNKVCELFDETYLPKLEDLNLFNCHLSNDEVNYLCEKFTSSALKQINVDANGDVSLANFNDNNLPRVIKKLVMDD